MKTAILFLAAAAAIPPAIAAPALDAQRALKFDLYACARPVYPAAALAQRVGGKATLEVRVGPEGQVLDAQVAASSGRTDLDAAALAGIRKCVFHVVAGTGQAPTGWLKTQYAWLPGAPAAAAPDTAVIDGTTALAAAGDAAAQNRLGAWYQHGSGVGRDLAQAAAWYRRAAESGNALAQNNLGVLYYRGAGVPGDPREAVHWYAKAAEQGHGWAQANLAWAYGTGSAGERDPVKALHWLTASAEGGLSVAQVRLGLLLLGRAASDDERAAAAAWLARAAAQDDPVGHYYLGRIYEEGLGGVQDDAQAAAAYRAALGRSAGRAETALGALIDAGRVAGAPEEALALYEQAMQARDGAAFYRYGLVLEQRGDTELAGALFQQGAALHHCESGVRYAQIRMARDPAYGTVTRRAPRPLSIESCKMLLESTPLF